MLRLQGGKTLSYSSNYFPTIHLQYINVTDRWTDGPLSVAIPRFALRALRGRNWINKTKSAEIPKMRSTSHALIKLQPFPQSTIHREKKEKKRVQ